MNTTVVLVWHAFLQSVPAELRNNLCQCLTPELSSKLEKTPPPPSDISRGIEPQEEELHRMHSSWFAPFLRTLSKSDIKLFLGCLTDNQTRELKKQLLLTNTIPHLTPLGSDFLRKTLFDQIAENTLIPISCLPANPLNILLELSPSEFTSLIELLSMHDLSVEIRHIIETAKLKEIYAILTKAQITFLKTLLHKKEAVTFKKMGLVNWNGDRESLQAMLLQRGINRISKSLYEHSPSLLWHIAHRLDSEKGTMLSNLCTALDHPKAATLLTEQLLELSHSIKPNNPNKTP